MSDNWAAYRDVEMAGYTHAVEHSYWFVGEMHTEPSRYSHILRNTLISFSSFTVPGTHYRIFFLFLTEKKRFVSDMQ